MSIPQRFLRTMPLVLAMIWPSPGSAHEIKILASQMAPERPGVKTTIYLSWGHRLPVDDLIEGAALERYDLLAPNGAGTALKKADLSLQANVVEVKEPGTFDYALCSQQYAKALIVVGPATTEPVKAAGLPIEIVPLDGPSAWKSGQMLRFQVLPNGKPLSAAVLTAHELVVSEGPGRAEFTHLPWFRVALGLAIIALICLIWRGLRRVKLPFASRVSSFSLLASHPHDDTGGQQPPVLPQE